MSTGLLMILAALFLTGYNIWQEKEAGNSSDAVVEQLVEEMNDGLQNENRGNAPTLDMPSIEIDGRRYIAVLQLPTLGLELPVMENWSYPNLRVAPCRYTGSVHTKDLIIAAHNYSSHFGKIKNLGVGDEVYLWDADGICHQYKVAGLEELGGTAVEEMHAGDWDLTLFTCTYGGRTRVTVRCVEKL